MAIEVETKPCPLCEADSCFAEMGSASGSRYYDCPVHGRWRLRNESAVTMGSLGGKARMNGLSAEERSQLAKEAADQRWLEEKLKKNVVVKS